MGTTPASALALAGVSKTFPGMKALDEVSFQVEPGSFHALVGGNGSGKSTLIKILAGVYQGDAGGIVTVDGVDHRSEAVNPSWSRSAGIRFVHQDLGLFAEMTAGENLFGGTGYPRRGGRIDWSALHRQAQDTLDRLHVPVSSKTLMADLRPSESTLVAIARCLRDQESTASLLVLDEPTARLPHAEVDELLARLKAFSSQGQTILYVSHRLDEVLDHADAVTVLRDGKHVTTRAVEGLSRGELTRLIVGENRDILTKRSAADSWTEGAPVLVARGLTGGPLRGVDLDVRAGEIVAVAGLVGSGRTSLLETIFGVHGREAGEVTVDGRPLRPRSVEASISAGLAYVPEDRGRDSAFKDLGLEMNLSAAGLRRYVRGGWFRRKTELADATADIARFSIRTPGVQAPLAKLSGGNQQKAVLARWLRLQPKILILDEPTQGVDVGARAEIYAQIQTAVSAGTAVLLVTSDLDELLHLADRISLIERGAITASAHGDTITRDWVVDNMFNSTLEESLT